MCRGWKGVALVAACWCLHLPAQAQMGGTYPSPVGAARMPEPIPCNPSQGPPPPQMPNLIPGPIGPQAAPMGPPDCLSLPADHTSAFQCENYVEECGFYVDIGPMALQRNHLGAGDVAVVNASAVNTPFFNAANGTNNQPIVATPFLPPPPGQFSAVNFNSVTPALSLGVIGTVGYLWHEQAIEFTSFYIWENDSSASAFQPNSLDTLFFNPPLTFLGDNLFRDANKVTLTQGSSLFNAELNYRRWNPAFAGLDFIFGLRYIRQNDNLSIASEGTPLITDILSTPAGLPPILSGRNIAIYNVFCHNNIFAPQFGLEYTLPICRWLSLSGMGKAGLGANYLTTDVNLQRGDGFSAFNTQRNAWNFAQVYQLGLFANINILERLRLQLGYTSTWLEGVAVSNDQVDFNLMGAQARRQFLQQQIIPGGGVMTPTLEQLRNVQNIIPHGHSSNNGSLIYFGPQIQLQFFF
ncbi:MAG TPA: hypothetical protein VH643_07720 [Gemmataceae bacterium]